MTGNSPSMSQAPGAAVSQANAGKIAELQTEIAFQKVLLESIDDSVENREEAEAEVKAEIKDLEKQLRILRPKANPPSSTLSTPHSDRTHDLVSPSSQMSVRTKKRDHSTHLEEEGLVPFEQNKSRRSSPSPYMGGPGTPASSSGDDDFEMFDNSAFDKNWAVDRQKVEEQRIRQEKADAEFARSLSQPTGTTNASASRPVVPSSRSAFDRMNGMRPPPTSSRAVNSEYGVKPNSYGVGSSSNSHMSGVKTEASSSRMPGSFDDFSDSDPEIIPAEVFTPNQRSVFASQTARQRPGFGGIVANNVRTSFEPSRRYHQDATSSTMAMAANSSLPGSHARSHHGRFGLSDYDMHEVPRTYGADNRENNYVYNGGMYNSVHACGNLHNVRNAALFPQQERVLNDAAGAPVPGSVGNVIDLYSPIPGLGWDGRPIDPAIFNRPSNAAMGEQYDYLINDPRKTNEEIQALLENIHDDVDIPIESREGTPDGLTYPLYEHQKIALTWMKNMEEGTNKGGVLADDMGLGKTISTLALILSRPSTDRTCKTNLIVGPVALIRQWEQEIRIKINASHRLSVHMIHGTGRKLSWDELRNYDVVLTTYGTLGAEFKRLEKWLENQKAAFGNDYDRAPMKKLFPLLSENSKFYRIVLDEAQMIKNKATNASRAAKNLRAMTRFALTGTPMMNNVGELYSLIHFLRIKPYNEWSRFSMAFGKLTKQTNARQGEVNAAMKQLQALLKAILLRRTKQTLIDGKPIINLPPKTEEVQHVVFNEDEQAYYNALENRTQIQFNKYMKAGTIGKNYSNVLDFEEAPQLADGLDDEAMFELAKSLAPDVVRRLLDADGFECPVCYDGVANPSIVIPCGHDTCSECLCKIFEQAALQNRNEGDEAAGAKGKCPNCRGIIEMRKVIDYATFKKVHMPNEKGEKMVDLGGSESELDDGSDTESSDSNSDSDVESEDGADSRGNLKGFVVPDDISDSDSNEEHDGGEGDSAVEYASKKSKKAEKGKRPKIKKSKSKGKGKKKDEKQHFSLAMLKKEAPKTASGRKRYMRYLRKNWQPSAKVDECVRLVERFQEEDCKTIIFSQFTSLLDLLQVPIDEKGWKCERYDGSMKANERHDAIGRFTDKKDVKIMLISLKAGNAGLNLVAASRVIILDPFWNPYIEMQAVDRAHRIGQQSPVEVHRILVENTVEDRIIALQEQKRKLVDSALDEGASKSIARLNVAQLGYLFGLGGNPAQD